MKRLRTVFLIVLCALMLFSVACRVKVDRGSSTAKSTDSSDMEARSEDREAWVNAILSEPADEEGNRSVYITRDPFTEQEIHDAFFEQYGYSPEPYEDDARCRTEIIPDIEAAMEEQYGVENAHSAEFGEALYGYPISPIKEAIREDAENYRSQRTKLLCSLYTAQCNEFLSKYQIPKENVKYLGSLTGSLIVSLSMETITKILYDESILDMEIWQDGGWEITGKVS